MKVKKKLKPLWAGASFCFAAYLLVGLGRIWGQGATEISGLIIDESGSPVKGALVGVLEQRVATMKEAQTDVGGRFRVTELSNTSLYRIVVTKYGYSQITVEALYKREWNIPRNGVQSRLRINIFLINERRSFVFGDEV